MKYYNYDPKTLEFLSDGKAQQVRGDYILPEFSTTEKPPKTAINEVAIFVDDIWKIVPDYRNSVVYDKKTKESKTINHVGEIEKNQTLLKPKKFSVWDEEANAWVDDLEAEKNAKIDSLSLALSQFLDEVAQAKQYDNALSVRSYAGYKNTFQKEAVKFSDFCSSVWNDFAKAIAGLSDALILSFDMDEFLEKQVFNWE